MTFPSLLNSHLLTVVLALIVSNTIRSQFASAAVREGWGWQVNENSQSDETGISCPNGIICGGISYVLLAVSGTLEEGFELRKNLDYRPFGDDGPGRVNATFLGKALVRGYKSFLDIKNPTCKPNV